MKSKKLCEEILYESMAENVAKRLGWLIPGAKEDKHDIIKLTTKNMHESLKIFDKTKKIQKLIHLDFESTDSDSDELEDPPIDVEKLKQVLKQLEGNNQLIIDSKRGELHNLRVRKRPGLNDKCDCSEGNLIKYKECCEKDDTSYREKTMKEIVEYIDSEKDENKLVFV